MKYLSQYIEEPQSKLLKEMGAFFAFNIKQFNEGQKEGVTYVRMINGLFCPKENADQLFEGLEKIHKAGIAQDMEENGKKAIIHRELANHEFCITLDITDTVNALQGYDITVEEIRAETGEYLKKWREWEDSQQ